VIARKEKVMRDSQNMANMMFVMRTVDAEDKPAYNSAHSESRESLHSADHHGHNYHTHRETTLPHNDTIQVSSNNKSCMTVADEEAGFP
jgi:hypothetical protein